MPTRNDSAVMPDVGALMLSYARIGLTDWNTTDRGLKDRARKCLGHYLAEDEGLVGTTLGARGLDRSKLRFIPMPTRNVKRDVERCFFVPIRQFSEGRLSLTLELFLLVRGEDCLGLRLEPANAAGESHDYAHVQMSRSLLGDALIVPTPGWIPESYPAFPSASSEPLDMVLFMMTAIHGHSSGVVSLLVDIFQAESRPLDGKRCIARLRALLGLDLQADQL
jgi:hypothetical protein